MASLAKKALEEYATRFAQKVCDDFFTIFKNTATGADILKITPIEQVNYFILLNLFENWKFEISKLKSPYFNYEKPEVVKALNHFANVLSNNILISRENLEPLIKNSVIQTIEFAFNPIDVLEKIISLYGDNLTIEQLQSWKKYFKINQNIINEFIDKFKKENKDNFDRNTISRIINELKKHFSTTSFKTVFDEILTSLSKVSAITEKQLEEQFELANETPSSLSEEDKETHLKVKTNAKNTSFQSDNTVIDYAISGLKKGISNKILDIKSALTVNQKFMFINHLFKGEASEFEKAVSHINALDNYDDAITFLLENYAVKYGWDTDNEQVEELFELIGRRFLKN